MYTIAWLLFILTCIVAVPIAALIDSQQRKKAQREAMMADQDQADPQDYDEQEGVVVAEDVEAVEAVAEPVDDAMPVAEGLPAADADDLFGEDLPK